MKFKDRISYLLAAYEPKVYTLNCYGPKQTYLDDFYRSEAVI